MRGGKQLLEFNEVWGKKMRPIKFENMKLQEFIICYYLR